MIGLALLILLVVWLSGVTIAGLVKLALILLVAGLIVDLLTGWKGYTWIRRR